MTEPTEARRLREQLHLAAVRLEIAASRMAACNETPQKHELVDEVYEWAKEARSHAKEQP
jgi:hypothetical protein